MKEDSKLGVGMKVEGWSSQWRMEMGQKIESEKLIRQIHLSCQAGLGALLEFEMIYLKES